MTSAMTRDRLDEIYNHFNRRRYVHPDPLEFLYGYPDLRDREIVAFIASALAYGRVVQIIRSVSMVIDRMVPSPFAFLTSASNKRLHALFKDFKHRFTTGEELVSMLRGLRRVIGQHGSLHHCFVAGLRENDDTIFPALSLFIHAVRSHCPKEKNSLLPVPDRGSACKRFNLFLRWMVRKDTVDPGGWDSVPVSKLIIPLDTHMHRLGLLLQFTKRRQASMRTAVEMTEAFKRIIPEDPVRYDFVLTRMGIRDDMDLEAFL